MSLVADTRRFARVRQQWLGDGESVVKEVAQARANACMACPKHSHQWREFVTAPVALAARKQLEVKLAMKLRVDNEKELHSCSLCLCYMPLKVWLGLARAREHTPDWQSFPPDCWLHGQYETSNDITTKPT